jgi:hypothetical protein
MTAAQAARAGVLGQMFEGARVDVTADVWLMPSGWLLATVANTAGVTVWLEALEPEPTSRLAYDTGAERA